MTEQQLDLWETVEEAPEGWRPMSTFPRDGTRCDVIVDYHVIVYDVWWNHITQNIIGTKNRLSPFLTPRGWRPVEEKPNVS